MQIKEISYYNYPVKNNVSSNTYYKHDSSCDTVSFTSSHDKLAPTEKEEYEKAQKYCNTRNKIPFLDRSFDAYNLKKLEGIQYGIPIFDGLNMKEVKFILGRLDAVTVKRGCPNQCLHCFVDAKPAGREHNDFINKMPYETFKEVTDGFSTLKNRIGATNIIPSAFVTSLFHDADCMDIVLNDKDNNEHGFVDLCKEFYDATGNHTVFDTAGWNQKSPKMQKRAEKYVEQIKKFYSEHNMSSINMPVFEQVNISMSPYNPIYAKAIELGYNPADKSKKSDSENYKKGEMMYNIYTDRMANMLYTFTPLLGMNNFNIISRPMSNNEKNMQDFNMNAYNIIRKDVFDKLRIRYEEDLSSNKKYVKNESDILQKMNQYSQLSDKTSTDYLVIAGRLKNLYDKRNPDKIFDERDYSIFEALNSYDSYQNLKKNQTLSYRSRYKTVIDANGKVYLFDEYRTIPTDMQLNLSTKDKQTAPFSPQENDGFVFKKEMII